MQKNSMWLPMIASIGVGAATYYTISKNNHGIEQTIQKILPFVSQQMTDSGNSSIQQDLGPHGMS